MFRGSWHDIAAAVKNADPALLCLAAACGLGFYALDAVAYHFLFRRVGTPLRFFQCVRLALFSPFFDVTTFGIGTKPAQIWYAHRHGADYGSTAGITTLPYALQKLLVVAFALGALIFQHDFIALHFGSVIPYIYLGTAVSLLLSAGLFLLCTMPGLHGAAMRLFRCVFRAPKWASLCARVEDELGVMAYVSTHLVRARGTLLCVWLLMGGKLILLYSVPAIALYAAYREAFGVTAAQLFGMTAILKLVMGVIPTAGGVGSLEVVFGLLFSAVFGEVAGGVLLVLFRVSTYYLPFVAAAAAVGWLLLSTRGERR